MHGTLFHIYDIKKHDFQMCIMHHHQEDIQIIHRQMIEIIAFGRLDIKISAYYCQTTVQYIPVSGIITSVLKTAKD